MAKISRDELQPCLLDRFIQYKPGGELNSIPKMGVGLDDLKNSVRENLESILSTCHLESILYLHDERIKQEIEKFPTKYSQEEQDQLIYKFSDYENVATSVINYGIPSVAGTLLNGNTKHALMQRIKKAIEIFEPRLSEIKIVEAKKDKNSSEGNFLDLQIECKLWANPVSEYFRIMTRIDLISEKAKIID